MKIDDSLRVLHLVTSREVFFEQQISTLESLGIECTVLVVPNCEQVDGAIGEKRGVWQYLRFFPTVRRELYRGGYDLIHANYGLTAPYVITQFRLPTVLTLWGSDVVGIDGAVTKACVRWVDAVTVRSEEMRELLGREDAYIVPSGVDLDRFRPIDQEKARDQVGWDRNKIHVLFPYSPEYERKNYPLAERVINQAEQEIDEQISLQTISGISHDEIPYYMNAANALLITSDYEGSPNTVKEAMACNVPVVSTDVGDVRERLGSTASRSVGRNEGELSKLLATAIKSKEHPDSRESVQEVKWDVIGRQLQMIYERVTKDTKQTRSRESTHERRG